MTVGPAPRELARRVEDDLRSVYRRVHRVRLVGVAAELAFFGAISVVPLLLSTIAVVGVLGEHTLLEVQAAIRRAATLTFAGDARKGVLQSLDTLFESRPTLLSISLLILLVVASRGFLGAIRALSTMYGTDGTRPWWHDRLAALTFTLAGVALSAFALVAFVVGPALGVLLGTADAAGVGVIARGAWAVTRYVVLAAGVAAFFSALYRYARGGHGSWTRDVPGAVVATALLFVFGTGYRVYLQASPGLGLGDSEVGRLVGAVLGGTLATLVLLALAGAALLIGGAFNAERDPDAAATEDLQGPIAV